LEVGDTAGLETCATKAGGRCLEKSSRFVTILTDSSAENTKKMKSGSVLCAPVLCGHFIVLFRVPGG
jgi:hypothetical protein